MATAIVTSTLAPPTIPLAKVPQTHKLLIIDHDRLVREACREAACSLGYIANTTDSAEQALWFVTSRAVDVVLLDWNLPNQAAPQFLELLRHRHPECEVVVLINTGQIRSAVEAIRGGAFDCLAKPFGLGELKLTLETVSERVRQVAKRRVLNNERKSAHGFSGIIGSTPEMERLYRIIGKAAQSSHPVLILGQSGTGKELVARSIHLSGPYRDKPFIPVDCGSLVPTLIESELFGHVKGAFTGAVHAKEGLLSMAEGGTIFLDEVGELPLDLQSKLLRAIQEREVRPVGSTKSVPMNARILAATNRDLELAVSQGQFRRDLYFRLNVLALRVPPLRDRREDIRDLVTSFLEREAKQSGRAYEISDDALNIMMAYDWPGNVRELQNCIEQCCALNSGPVIHVADLPSSIKGSQGKLSSVLSEAKICSMAELERRAILGAIEQFHGDKLSAARALGIGKTTLYRKLKDYGAAEPVVRII
jgi:two-component system response regulator HydG